MGGPSGTSRDAGSLDAKARGIVDPGTESRIASIDDEDSVKELRRADFRDAYREGMISRFTDESLADEDIFTLLIRARQAADGIVAGWGPRTQYAHATNLLALYAHLLDRARASPRDRDGTLLTKQRYPEKLAPWSADRIKRVEDIPQFQPDKIKTWNSIVALGPPPDYDPRRPWNGVRPPKVKEFVDRRPIPGRGGAGVIELPMGMYAVIRPGGADARIQYKLIKTPDMNVDSPEGRKHILAAVISQILEHKQSEAYYDDVAVELLKRQSNSPRGVVYANDPRTFNKMSDTREFSFEVGVSFLMNLDEVTEGLVPMKTLQLLEPGVDVKKHEARPLWEELYPNNSRRERAFWGWKRMADARRLYDPSLGRPVPGHFYEGNQMFYVADGMFAGDQIWMTEDARLFTVNQREAMIEAFRQGVLAAAGMIAVAYIQIALALILVEGPAIVANIARIVTAPVAATKELLLTIAANPLKVLGSVALDQAAAFTLSGDKEKFLEDFGGAETWLQVFLSLLMIKDLRQIHLPSGGGKFVTVGNELHFIPTASTAREAATIPGTPFEGPLVAGGESGKLTADAPTTAPVTKTPVSPPVAKPGAVADEGASAVIHTEGKPIETAGDAPRKPPETAGDAPRKATESAGDTPPRRGTTDAERANTGKQRSTEEEDVDVDVADAAGGGRARPRTKRQPGARGQSRQRRPEPAGGKRGIDGRSRGTRDSRGRGGGRKRGGGGRVEPDEADEAATAVADAGGAGKKGGAGDEPPKGGEGGPPKRGGKGEPPGGGKAPGGRGNRGVDSSRATGEREITFTRDGIDYRITVSAESRRAYDNIPVGDTVVYTVHDPHGEVIYIGISKKTRGRQAINRLQEHLKTKDGDFVAEASDFRIVGHYGDEKSAHALEQFLVTTTPTAVYNKDKNPWLTFVDYYASKMERYPRQSRGLDDDLRTGAGAPSRKQRQDWEGQVPQQMDKPIRFGVDLDYGVGPARGPRRPARDAGVDPDFDPDFDPRFDL